MPSKLKTLITKKFSGVEIWEVYGLSEGGKTVLRPADCIRKFASVGKAVGCEEVKLVDDNDIDVGLGKSGEILFRAPSVMKGYYKNPEATAEALKGGWLHTGDVGKFDEEGFLYIVDRKKDMIISGGENIYPREIEEVLASHPKIFEVAVYGVPDRKWGESVKATVVLKEGEIMTEEEVINCCLANLARFKKPRSVEFTDSLPRSASGKILKRELREKHSKI
jgi:acyl-CoA synthetase (AMP-forming)/AMP-acid ligase II